MAIALVLGLTFPAIAANDSAPLEASNMPPKLLAGKVVSLDEGKTYFVIQSQGQDFTISVNSDTKYLKVSPPRQILSLARNRLELRQGQIKLGPMLQKAFSLGRHRAELKQQGREKLEMMRQFFPFGEKAGFDDITVGTQVRVRVVPEEANLVAKLVIIVTVTPITPDHVIGTITGISSADKTITIAPVGGGDEIPLKYNEKTRFILRGITGLAEGQSVRAVYDEEMVATVFFAPIAVSELAD